MKKNGTKRVNAKKPRRKYKKNGALTRLVQSRLSAEQRQLLLERIRTEPIPGSQQSDINVAYTVSLKNLVEGGGTDYDWANVVVSLNIAMILVEAGLGPEYEDDIVAALDGMFRMQLRAKRFGKWIFDGTALQAVNRALEVHEAQLELATHQQVIDAKQVMHQRISSGNVYKEAA